MKRTLGWLLLGVLSGGCASTRSAEALEDEGRASPSVASNDSAAPPAFDAKAFAAQFPNPAVCERQARRYQSVSRESAWSALKACVEGTPFTQLQALIDRAWAPELRTRPEGAALLAKVVAQRGGSVEGDLRLLHERKLPIFSLSSAIAQPDTYKGRYVLVRAQVGDMRSDGEKSTLWLVEHGLGSVSQERQAGTTRRRDSAFTTTGALDGQTTLGSGNVGGSLAQTELSRDTVTIPSYDNISNETGREALGRLASQDPFLEPGRDFIILARFDGMRTTSGASDEEDEGPRIPVLSIVSYYMPHPLVVY
ncbi:hypothetical protein [Stigmatella aurantiaca]|uniref:Conserved uncharacterized protein n=1 Tax=Stigmatella aurantiaca (strain DW4/3-1) TaxID=378806 RepID=Q08TR1_STIAD|nr:hypothetical protein [Stigmatella aurantiaca]ADO71958.1 conserved uncharacterized protein [Stigmatella aurantiaca DW4/3-1]EAU63879.1 hypothetical protein STIAU_6369 [Stigmatella aurantiaca DW4/3-1]